MKQAEVPNNGSTLAEAGIKHVFEYYDVYHMTLAEQHSRARWMRQYYCKMYRGLKGHLIIHNNWKPTIARRELVSSQCQLWNAYILEEEVCHPAAASRHDYIDVQSAPWLVDIVHTSNSSPDHLGERR